MNQPSLLNLPEPAPVSNPVRLERERLNAAALRVLHYLQTHGSATNVTLCDPAIGGMRAVGRIAECRNDGWDIRKEHVKGGVWKYTLVGMK